MKLGRISLRFNIAFVFTVLILVISTVQIYYIYEKNSRSMLELADTLILSTSKGIVDRTEMFFGPVGISTSNLAVLARTQEPLIRRGDTFPMLDDMLSDYPQIQSIYFAFHGDGSFLQVFAIPPDTRRFGPSNALIHPDTTNVSRMLKRDGKIETDDWIYLNKDGVELRRERAKVITYDARKRSWYQECIKGKQLYWSEIKFFTSTGLPGLTTCYPIYSDSGKLNGVVAANVTLERISQFLRELKVGKNGMVFFMDRQARLIAYPEADKVVRKVGTENVQAEADAVGPPWVAAAVRMYRAGKRDRFSFDFEGRQYLASFTDMPKEFGKPWVISIIVPANDFIGELKNTNRDLVVIVLVITVLGLLFVNLLSGILSRSIAQMGIEADKIRHFDLKDKFEVRSHIKEIHQLGGALSNMKEAIHAFARFVPRELVSDLVATGKPIGVGGQFRHITVMFTDIQGFTGIAERMPAQDLMLHLSEHFNVATKAIADTSGTIDKFIGDSVMAFWGAPNLVENSGRGACLSALVIREQTKVLNAMWTEQGKPTLFIRFGIHSDAVVVGNIGSPERLSYTALGDGVVIAQRLEEINKTYGTQICISQAVYREIGDQFVCRPVDFVAVRGRRGTLLIYELLGLRNDEGDQSIVASEQQHILARATQNAFDAYNEKRWADALTAYQALAEQHPHDKLFSIFVTRCEHYVQHPPGADWSGVFSNRID